MNEPWLTPREAAAYLRITEKGLAALRLRRKGPLYHKLGTARCSRVRYSRAALDTWIVSNAGTATPPAEE